MFSLQDQRASSLPPIPGYQHKIVLRSGATPMQFKLRRLPLSVREEVSQKLLKLLDDDIERIKAAE